MTNLKINGRFITVNGKRIKVSYCVGPWIEGTPADLIKIRPWTKSHFPREFLQAFEVENNSDMTTDYFESDCIRMTASHPLYATIKSAAA